MAKVVSQAQTQSKARHVTPPATRFISMRMRLRRLHLPRSLRVQMAVGSALVALTAVLVVTVAAVLSVSISFNQYQRSQLENEASLVATTYAQNPTLFTAPVASIASAQSSPRLHFGAAYIWTLDSSGNLLTPPTTESGNKQIRATLTQDRSTVSDALHAALAGQSSEGALPGNTFSLIADRLYVAIPVHQGGISSNPIIGAVALSTPPRAERSGVITFLRDVNTAVLLASVCVALLAALVAIIFSRRLTRPLLALDAATVRMASGDYAARVHIDAPSEYGVLATSFNDMAAALERDIAELRHQEQLRRELVANVSHELATPLTAIEGFTEALLDGVVHDPQGREETARTIAREAARLHRLVDQLRQVSLFEAGAQALDRAALDVPTLVAETLAVLAPELEQKGIALTNQLPSDLPPVYADGDRVTEILLNLLDNALRYTPAGGRITVSGAIVNQFVRVSVSNNGATIALDQRERIFERFYRGDASRSATTGGTGLGLAIVKALVEAHGGAIWVDTPSQGEGVRFTFTLPIAPASPS